MGGGWSYFLPNSYTPPYDASPGKRTDGRNLVDEWLAQKKEIGCSNKFVTDSKQLMDVDASNIDCLLGKYISSLKINT